MLGRQPLLVIKFKMASYLPISVLGARWARCTKIGVPAVFRLSRHGRVRRVDDVSNVHVEVLRLLPAVHLVYP